ncbi:MAG: tatB [Pseudonocardia sp.]|nr:tatB [Pseudonocardia sp.]
MFDSVGWGEILVLVVVGLFVLGPERLPAAAAWLGKTVRQLRGYASGARDQLRSELGPEFEQLREPLNELRGLRGIDPRRAVTRSLFDDDPAPIKPNGFTAGSTGGANGGPPAQQPTMEPVRELGPGERPPIDPDAT